MKRDLKLLAEEVHVKMGLKDHLHADWEKLMEIFRKHHVSFKDLSPATLDRIALLVGYQNWKDFQSALHGVADDEVNYESDDK